MNDFLSNPSVAIYTALAVALVVWGAIFLFLWRLDAQARELTRKIDRSPANESATPSVTIEARDRRTTTETIS